jgi:hypothetical protein
VKAGFTTKEVESRLFNLDDTKLIVTQSGGKHAVAFCRYLIQRDKKATSFDTLLNNPDNAVKVFQELANQKRKAQELEAQLPRLFPLLTHFFPKTPQNRPQNTVVPLLTVR